jgi:hypothetical protein
MRPADALVNVVVWLLIDPAVGFLPGVRRTGG